MDSDQKSVDERFMWQAIEFAAKGEGRVEPNPMVGCVITRQGDLIGAGFHEKFGGAHAEVNAIESCVETTDGGTAYVTLEPCSHTGKTPPCSDKLIAAGIKRVVIGTLDPFQEVRGKGVDKLKAAGIECEVGVLKKECRAFNAPYFKRIETGRPWIIGKWAMTLDGKIATRTGDSQWISNEHCRAIVHQIRGRVDAIMVGIGTVLADDPLLTARPAGPRIAQRIIVDSNARIPMDSQLLETVDEAPVTVVTGPSANSVKCQLLTDAGVNVWSINEKDADKRLSQFMHYLGEQQVTNVLVEGGSELLAFFGDPGELDEVHVFIAPKIAGGLMAPSAVGGIGCEWISEALTVADPKIQVIKDNVYICGRVTA